MANEGPVEYRYFCASCVEELVREGVATESDMGNLQPAPWGWFCDWCMVAPATLMEALSCE